MTTSTWLLLTPMLALACAGDPFVNGSGDSNLGKSGGGNDASAAGSSSSSAGGKTGSGGGVARGAGGMSASGGASSSGGITGSGGGQASGGVGGSVPDGGASGSDGTGGVTGGGTEAGAPLCFGPGSSFPTFVKGCSTVANCVLVQHQTSCCGDALILAINHGERTAFDAAEKICEAEYPACGCASQGLTAEDGTLVTWDRQSSIVAACDNNVCHSKYGGKTFACGSLTCTNLDYCSVTVGGAFGSAPSYSCVPMGVCTSCACLPNSGACTCSVASVGSTVTCNAP